MAHLLDLLSERVLLCDGGMGSRIQALDLELERDFWGKENCTEVLTLSRPELVRDIHRGYFAAGADMVETNTFGGSPLTLGEFELADRVEEINRRGAELAREAAEGFSDGRQRFVLGSIGPGTRLPSLGHIAYRMLEDAYAAQCRGLVAGGVDALLIETCQDPLQIKAAVNGAKRAREAAGIGADALPVFVQVTVEATGTMLVGTDIAGVATLIEALGVPLIGLNCATGPREMLDHIRWLSESWPGLISCQPNAGLPERVDGRVSYPLQPEELANWHERFVTQYGVSLLGGCCGTNVPHIAATDAMLRRLGGAAARPVPVRRTVHWVPAVASLYGQVPLRQENAVFAIGERCNANGSKKWRQLQERQDWDGCVAMAREQAREGSHALDVCTAFVGRDEAAEMTEVVSRLASAVSVPLVIDSTEYGVLERALELYGGKAILNSINFEDGEGPARARLALARRHGSAVIALTIDEQGMARTSERKLEVARRLYALAVGEYGLPPSDLLFDPLTFTIATGNEDDRKLALWTLEGIQAIRAEMPETQIILGLSNVSFGLSAATRAVLNSVFLDHAVRRGVTGAIVHASKIVPLHKLAAEEVAVAEDLIFDRRREGYDPLQAMIALFAGRSGAAGAAAVRERPAAVEDRLKRRIVDGDRKGLDTDLAEALVSYAPLEIINGLLLEGMREVGELFGSGKMQLPFVLQSAETMKAAVAWLEPYLEAAAVAAATVASDGTGAGTGEGAGAGAGSEPAAAGGRRHKGTLVLATVKGDVHDIGKNLVDIILTNNGYRVVNLGIRQPVDAIITAAREHRADAVGMSGLLVKSTVVMKENLEEMSRQGLTVPVLLGGAALTRGFVDEDCAQAYVGGRVAYGRDAFDGLTLMEKVVSGNFDAYTQALRLRHGHAGVGGAGGAEGRRRRPGVGRAPAAAVDPAVAAARRLALAAGVAVPVPPFWGARVVEQVSLKMLVPFLNERTLFQLQWGYRKDGRSLAEFTAWARKELRPILWRMLETCAKEQILQPRAVYGYWPCAAEGDDIVLYDPADAAREVWRLNLPRQAGGEGRCVADFVRDASAGERDVIGLQVVTMGASASATAQAWFEADRYQDYLHLHGVGVEMAEAMAEYIHARIRAELGFAGEDAPEPERLLQQGYRGSRYSFGYPACPRLEDQVPLLALLGAERIGVALSDEYQLVPEQSTSAIVLHHPGARYFTL